MSVLTGEAELLQAHFAKFTGRDAAMSKSLNSDYLSQLYIRADTKSMDREFVKAEVATSGLPEEARALVVWKRGYASAVSATLRLSASANSLLCLCCLSVCLSSCPSVRLSVCLSVCHVQLLEQATCT